MPGRIRGAGQPSYRDLFGLIPGRSTVAQERLSVPKIREVLRLKSDVGNWNESGGEPS